MKTRIHEIYQSGRAFRHGEPVNLSPREFISWRRANDARLLRRLLGWAVYGVPIGGGWGLFCVKNDPTAPRVDIVGDPAESIAINARSGHVMVCGSRAACVAFVKAHRLRYRIMRDDSVFATA